MSIYEWEAGTITLPRANFATFRRELNSFYNARQLRLFTKAVAIFDAVKAELKGKRGADLSDIVRPHLQDNRIVMGFSSTTDIDGADEIYEVLLPNESGKLTRPRKKDFSTLPLAGNVIRGDGWSIRFNAKTQSVHWSVIENNHACERAHEDTVVAHFFSMLHRVIWVRGTGGEIVGNDEYNRDSGLAGGGGNYVNYAFGPKATAPIHSRHGFR